MESVSVTEKGSEQPPITPMIPGVSASIGVLQRVIPEIAPTDIPVLVIGESGTGKALVASEIHRLSAHSKGAFVKFDCASMDLDLLLGTTIQIGGQRSQQPGTLVLHGVCQLDLEKQALLLKLLADRGGVASGSSLTSRLISTNTTDLAEEMRSGNFQDELYFQLNGICLRIPALRQRKDDIPILFAAFLSKYSNFLGCEQPRIENSTMDLLLQHAWPGNVRELENVARKMVVLGNDQRAIDDLLMNRDAAPRVYTPPNADLKTRSLKQVAREASRKAEQQLILESLERTHWNRKRTAQALQISYKALLYKLKQLDLNTSKKS